MQLSVRAALGALLLAAPLHAADPLVVTVAPSGPSPVLLRTIAASANRMGARTGLAGDRWALLSLEVPPGAQDRYRAILYDYTRNHAWVAEGAIREGPDTAELRPLAGQPIPSLEEFQRALAILEKDKRYAALLRSGNYAPFRPMPPVLDTKDDVNRTVNVGLIPTRDGLGGQIVGVDLVAQTAQPYSGGVPDTSLAIASATACGPANANLSTTPRGTAGQANVTISRSGTTLWQFTVVRPSVSSGTNGSGIEFVNVRYKGKTVLARMHIPIMNVRYVNDVCGPYRDWQWEEHPFNASGTTVAPGILNASSMPTTILDTGSDTGNYAGVAYFVDTSSVTFKSELQAGWYRYTPTYVFDDNGTIHARVGFAGIDNGCVCNIHLHNAFFRLVFDIDGAANSTLYQRNQGGWQIQATERAGRRDRLGATAWLVKNPSTGDTYQVNAGPYDYIAEAFGVGDWWQLRSHDPSEIDDGISCVTCSNAYIQIGQFVNGESIQNTQIVLWYGGHFLHNVNDNYPTSGGEIVGPDIVPVSW